MIFHSIAASVVIAAVAAGVKAIAGRQRNKVRVKGLSIIALKSQGCRESLR